MTLRLGIDLGGTKIEGILIDEQFQVIKRERVPTLREKKVITQYFLESLSWQNPLLKMCRS